MFRLGDDVITAFGIEGEIVAVEGNVVTIKTNRGYDEERISLCKKVWRDDQLLPSPIEMDYVN